MRCRWKRRFLDITDIVNFTLEGEQGLLSVAFPPDYEISGRFYVAFNNKDTDIELDEFTRSESDETVADPATRRVLLTVPHRAALNHNGGQLQFGPFDGFLYMSTGDGGGQPPGEAARDVNNLLGKILRIKPLPTVKHPYGIPRSNPFVGRDGSDEIFAYGLRNPWRFSFDGRRPVVADVGRRDREEINFLRTGDVTGVNFGWPQYEGDIVFDDTRPGPDPATFPMFTYDHSGGRCAIIGGYVVHDPNLPRLAGRYVYRDACTGEVRSFIAHVTAQEAVHDRASGLVLPGVSGFGRGASNEIYLTQIGGSVWRLVPPAP
jgi:glucose/arabinose dehydrogenase